MLHFLMYLGSIKESYINRKEEGRKNLYEKSMRIERRLLMFSKQVRMIGYNSFWPVCLCLFMVITAI